MVIVAPEMAERAKTVKYEGNPKHKHPWQHGRRGSLCPKEIGLDLAQALLAGSVTSGAARFATHGGQAFCAREHGADLWHGYPVGWREVPPEIRSEWVRSGLISRQDIRRNW
jgi:hypothetical protein